MAMTEPQGRTRSVRQVVAASFIGTTIEWYDFFLYGTAAALVFNKLFFPEAEPSSGTLLALATYGVGFAARPLGGIIFGHFGDRIGRKAMLVLSLLIMGVATFLIGAMPTHALIGIWAPVILALLSVVLIAIGLFVRLRLYESPAFQRVKETQTEAPMPILDVLRKYPREVLLAMGMRIAENGTFYILTVWVLVYGNEHLELPKSTMLWGVVIAALIGLVTIPLYGALSDRVGRRPLYLGGALFSLVFAFRSSGWSTPRPRSSSGWPSSWASTSATT
jgi:MFS family permease